MGPAWERPEPHTPAATLRPSRPAPPPASTAQRFAPSRGSSRQPCPAKGAGSSGPASLHPLPARHSGPRRGGRSEPRPASGPLRPGVYRGFRRRWRRPGPDWGAAHFSSSLRGKKMSHSVQLPVSPPHGDFSVPRKSVLSPHLLGRHASGSPPPPTAPQPRPLAVSKLLTPVRPVSSQPPRGVTSA